MGNNKKKFNNHREGKNQIANTCYLEKTPKNRKGIKNKQILMK